jgi:hypothetical protein
MVHCAAAALFVVEPSLRRGVGFSRKPSQTVYLVPKSRTGHVCISWKRLHLATRVCDPRFCYSVLSASTGFMVAAPFCRYYCCHHATRNEAEGCECNGPWVHRAYPVEESLKESVAGEGEADSDDSACNHKQQSLSHYHAYNVVRSAPAPCECQSPASSELRRNSAIP